MFQVFFFCSRGSALGFTTSELAVCVTELYSRNQGSKPSTADQWYLSLSESIEMQTAVLLEQEADFAIFFKSEVKSSLVRVAGSDPEQVVILFLIKLMKM